MKVVVHKETGLYGHYMGKGEFGYAEHPQIFPDTMNLENFKIYVKKYEGYDLMDKNIEVKEAELIVFD